MTRKLIIALLLSLTLAGIAAAQSSGGQMCVRAFEDRNGDGQKSDNEPFITRGLSATLANEQNVIIATMFIESSANASGGTMCFQRLASGQYTMRINSADYMSTTTNEFIGVVSDTGIPVVFPYGGQIIPMEVPQASSTDPLALSEGEQQAFFLKLVFSGIGAVVIMGAMVVVGAIIYFAFLRNTQSRKMQTASYPRVPDSGVYTPVPATGSQAAVTDTGSYLPLDDTDQSGMVATVDDHAEMYSDDDTDKPRSTVLEAPAPYANVPDDDFSFEPDDEVDDPDADFRPPQD